MSTVDILWFVWPWVGLGGGIVIVLLLAFSNCVRSDPRVPRRHNPTWLAWATAAAYLFHVCEEYGLHVSNGQYELITQFQASGIDATFGGLPLAFFPYMNIALTWVGLPLAALLSRKHPVVGLSGSGFLLLNGLTHIGASTAMGMSLAENGGAITGIFVFIPLAAWIIYSCVRHHLLPKGGIAIAVTSGVIGHVLLFAGYGINLALGHAATYVFIPFVALSSMIVAWLLCKIFKVRP